MEVELNYSQLCELVDNFKDIKITKPQKCLFNSISDLYYRENFHSDILAYYLSYDLVKKKLIDWINRYFKENTPGKWIDFSLYKGGPDPIREEGRRDITIYSKDKNHAIIIENKSNGAGDMPYQIPRYYADLKSQEKYVDAIIYLNKEYCKQPNDMYFWTCENKEILEIFQQSEEKQVSKYISEIKNKLVIATLNRDNGFTQNIIDDVLKESMDMRLLGVSHEIKILFENIINGECNMADREFEKHIINKYKNNDEEFTKLQKCHDIFSIIPKKLCELSFEKLMNVRSKTFNKNGNKILYFDFIYPSKGDGEWQYYMEIIFDDSIWANKIKIQYAVREVGTTYYANNKPEYYRILSLLNKISVLYGLPTDDKRGFIVTEYSPKNNNIFDMTGFIGYIQNVISILEAEGCRLLVSEA